nr:substrate-binding domain-containing protein [uncultured Desulfobacter sp.]
MKKFALCIAVLTIGLFFSGHVLAEEISIVGTGSGSAVLKSVGSAFSQRNPGISISVPKSIGSGGGIKAVGKDENVIGRVAREIKDKEKPFGLTYLPYAKNPIVFFVNKSVGITDLTTQQVCDIYSGKIVNWKDVGGKDSKIRVIRREDGDSSIGVLLKVFPGFADITLTSKSKTTFSDPKTCELTQAKADTIAFGTYANARNYNVDILSINGTSATSADYAYVGTLALIFKEKNKTGNIAKFLDFATSDAAHAAIKEAGAIPF